MSATFKEYLEVLMDLKRNCTIKFRSVEGGVSEIKAHITEINNEGGRDMIVTDAGISIGFDQLIAVNSRQPDNYC